MNREGVGFINKSDLHTGGLIDRRVKQKRGGGDTLKWGDKCGQSFQSLFVTVQFGIHVVSIEWQSRLT